MIRAASITAILLALTAAPGCTPQQEQNVQTGFQQTGTAIKTGARNAVLEGKVKSALATRSALKGVDIDVEANGSVVSLNGIVQSRDQSAMAEEVAVGTDGVTEVQNNLQMTIPATP